MKVRITVLKNKKRIDEIVDIHMKAFSGFFLTFLGSGFLKQLYKGFMQYKNAGLIVAIDKDDSITGFLAYSDDLSGFYKFLIRKKLIIFAWYSICAFLKDPKILLRLFRAFSYSRKAEREEKYIEISSIGVLPEAEGSGIGSEMICYLKRKTISEDYDYIKLETDAENNEKANRFYQKNGFVLSHVYVTREKRKMNEYRYYY